jgi:DNA-binding transcriptional MerR regulator
LERRKPTSHWSFYPPSGVLLDLGFLYGKIQACIFKLSERVVKATMIFGRKAVQGLTGVSGRQLDYWATTGVVRPSAKSAAGKGSRREYSFPDLVALKVAKRLKDEGISLQKIRKSLAFLRKHFPDLKQPLAELRFLTDGATVYVGRDREKICNTLNHGQFVFSLALGEIIGELQGELKQFAPPKEEKVRLAGQTLTVVLTPDIDGGGFTIQCRQIPAAVAGGATEQEALDRIIEVLAEHQRRAGQAG